MFRAKTALKKLYEEKYANFHLLHQADCPFNELFIKLTVVRTQNNRNRAGDSIPAEDLFGLFSTKDKKIIIEGHAGSGNLHLFTSLPSTNADPTAFLYLLIMTCWNIISSFPCRPL